MELEAGFHIHFQALSKKLYGGRYVGQNKNGLLVGFWKRQEFDLETHKPEFEEWKWIRPEDAIKFVVRLKKLYRDVLKGFENLY